MGPWPGWSAVSNSQLQASPSSLGIFQPLCSQPLHSHLARARSVCLACSGGRRLLNFVSEALCDFVRGDRVRLHLIADRRISSQTTSLAPNQVWESKRNINLSPFKTIFFFPFFPPKEKNSRRHLSACAFQTGGPPSQSQAGPPEPWNRQCLSRMSVLPLALWGVPGPCLTEAPQNYSHETMLCPGQSWQMRQGDSDGSFLRRD